ncbi:glutathione S-transferase family protein [Pelagerythrobacter marensis]|uniref:Glutathione S-transferase family protein n=1 Tax=Pelagerythrobacter marensis TaxID=543877 RepID=A0ABZ2D3J6_9SPHN
MENCTVTGFDWVPPFARGIVRDLRVRWALEEAGVQYAVEWIGLSARKSEDYRRKQPFGMVPALAAGDSRLFESGAIVQLIAERSEALMPAESAGRAETIVWIYAALNTVEPPLDSLLALDLVHGDEEWAPLRRPGLVEEVQDRLAVVAARLEGREFLLDRFTAADILMATVLRLVRHTDLCSTYPPVDAYLRRCEGREPFQRALEGQLADYARNEPAAA